MSIFPSFSPHPPPPPMRSLRDTCRGAWGRGSEQRSSAQASGLAEETQERRGLPLVSCSALTSPGRARKYISGLKRHFCRQMTIFPTRFKYLKSRSEPKRHNHLSVQLGPDIKHGHDQRDHQQLQRSRHVRTRLPRPAFFTSPSHTAIQKAESSSTH